MYSIEAHEVSLIQRLRIDIWQYELPCLRCNVAGVVSSYTLERFLPLDKGLRTYCLFIYKYVRQCLTKKNSSVKMTETTITLPMGKADLQEAATAVIEQLATAPPDFSQMSDDRVVSYTMGVEVLCDCLRSTFQPAAPPANA